jgi:hypothetical protein
MVAVTGEQFASMNIMAGTARSLERSTLSSDDKKVWDRDFDLIVKDMKKLVDVELAEDLQGEKDWYTSACEVAKGYFNDKPFGGLKSSTGQFGFRLLGPQDLKTDATGATPAFYSWLQTLTTSSGKSYKQYAIGYGSAAVYSRNASEKKEVIAFHRLLSYKPTPKIILVEFSVNDYPYVPYNVEVFSKIAKDDKLFKIIPMPGRVLLHPGGHFYTHMYFDLGTGATAPSGTNDVDIEVAPFGLVFAEYDYLAASELT